MVNHPWICDKIEYSWVEFGLLISTRCRFGHLNDTVIEVSTENLHTGQKIPMYDSWLLIYTVFT